ncbi:DUF6249 domain-containing protein [Tenacibaculum sp. HL-MS23]|uniref:DUF6249 domain-containing protein n=1 Tax=unclassified Tenacibaculum TaxID=2635139 RepID=UPI001C4E4D43|nr:MULTISPECIES: DUF6249 domain-containing protein [unclassified Tenacibaculum]QXP74598.1 hypothetical protein H0I30_05600 [Tenacibaculum sp. AHE14PA]QXP76109.1 hypothetical protein H0I31_00340 [Tenacibaculum sp. AHE15PA]WNW02686.1 DUF6249 domain-containing protein [Tenacibaculum sp. HL-MS23]
MEVAVVFMFLFAIIFGIFYLFYSTRNKERLALIEKGVDAKIFMQGERKKSTLTGRIIVLNLALLLMGIGLGIFFGLIIDTYTSINEDAVYPAMIFLMAGVGLFAGFNITKKLDNE